MDVIMYALQQVFEELPGCFPIRLVDEVGDCKFAGLVNADEKIQLALRSLHLGNIDIKNRWGSA